MDSHECALSDIQTHSYSHGGVTELLGVVLPEDAACRLEQPGIKPLDEVAFKAGDGCLFQHGCFCNESAVHLSCSLEYFCKVTPVCFKEPAQIYTLCSPKPEKICSRWHFYPVVYENEHFIVPNCKTGRHI